jgi:branched-chain amino acid aminotransferase
MDPAAAVLHYGQALFEGMKVFRGADDRVRLYRVTKHAERMAKGARRLSMPALDEELFVSAVRALVSTDSSWVPGAPGASLYLRPTLVATEPFLGVRPADHYTFFIIASPVGAYYGGATGGIETVKISVERTLTRAAPGGLGAVKAGANYAASLGSALEAKKRGYAQVLWTDALRHEFVEEVGTMNFFAVLGDELVTPPLSDTILAGITRDSVLTLARDRGLRVSERPLSLTELRDAQRHGRLTEAFGTGTAAVVSPIGALELDGEELPVGAGRVGPVAQSLYDEVTGIQRGTRPDRFGWLSLVD